MLAAGDCDNTQDNYHIKQIFTQMWCTQMMKLQSKLTHMKEQHTTRNTPQAPHKKVLPVVPH